MSAADEYIEQNRDRFIEELAELCSFPSIANQGAEGIRACARQAKDRSLEMDAAELRIRAERRLGQMIELQKRNGSWQAKTPAEQEGWIKHMKDEHVTPQQVGQMAAAAGVKTVVMTHFTPTVNPKDDYQRYVDGAKTFFSGSILLAKDLMQF